MKRFSLLLMVAVTALSLTTAAVAIGHSSSAEAQQPQRWEYMYIRVADIGRLTVLTDRPDTVEALYSEISDLTVECDEDRCVLDTGSTRVSLDEVEIVAQYTVYSLGRAGWEIFDQTRGNANSVYAETLIQFKRSG